MNFTPTAAPGSTITANISSSVVAPTGMTPVNQVIKNGEANTITLNTKANDTKVVFTVIAPDGKSSKTYTVNVEKAAASANDDATLTGLTVDSLITFAPDKATYSATVANDKDSVKVTPTGMKTGAKVLVNGEVLDGTAVPPVTFKDVDLKVGDNKIEVKVIAADNKTSKVYTVNVKRVAVTNAKDAALNSISLSAGELGGTFTPDFNDTAVAGVYPTVQLTTTVPNTVEDLTITPIASNSNSTVEVTASNVGATPNALVVEKNGSAFTVKGLKDTNPTVVTVKVTSADAKFTKEYQLTVTRAKATASDIANLSDLMFKADSSTVGSVTTGTDTVSGFDKTKTDYVANVANGQENFGLQVVKAANSETSVTLNGVEISQDATTLVTGKLNVGKNVIKVKVTAENAANSRTYTYEVNRASSTASTDADLKEINSSKGKLVLPAKDTNVATGSHVATLATNETDFSITPLAKDANAAISVIAYKGDKTATSKTALMTLGNTDKLTVEKNGGTFNVKDLTSGDSSVFVLVEAEDGSTSAVYEVLVNKAAGNASDAAVLEGAGLVLTGKSGALTVPALVAGKTDYTVQAKFADTTVSYTALVAGTTISTGATAEVKVNGNVVAAGAGVEAPLKVGANTVTVTVTAADGKTKTVYTYTVNRSAEGASNQAGLTKLTSDKGEFLVAAGGAAFVPTPSVTSTAPSVATLEIPNVDSVVITPVKADDKSTVIITSNDAKGNGVDVTPNGNGTFTVADLDNAEEFVVKVTSEDGLVNYSTTVTVDKVTAAASKDAYLNGLALANPIITFADFAVDKFEYNAYVANDKSTIDVSPTIGGGTVTSYEINGETKAAGTGLALIPGQVNVIKVNVLAADRVTEATYTINVNRAAATDSTVATLKTFKDVNNDALLTVPGTPGPIVSGAKVKAAGDAFTFIPTTTDAGATITATADVGKVTKNADGSFTTSGIATAATVNVTIKVTAADKATSETYTIAVKGNTAP